MTSKATLRSLSMKSHVQELHRPPSLGNQAEIAVLSLHLKFQMILQLHFSWGLIMALKGELLR